MALAGEFGSAGHLARRFFGALSPAGPRPPDATWAVGHLGAGERELWARMSGPDQRHAVEVARDALVRLGGSADREVVAAALLHDVGKVESGFGTFARVGITLAAIVAGRERLSSVPQGAGAVRHRVADYLTHDRIGGRLLRDAGSAPLTAAWAAEHHLPADRWSVPEPVGRALKAADGD